MEFDVTKDRDKWIGGSDIPCIMNISPFKSRYELLQEKCGLRANDFEGNKYTEYGNILEPQIRDFINHNQENKFVPNQVIKGDLRGNTDGFNGECVLEIKTTSTIHETVSEYEIYLVQLLFYMQLNKVKKGMLAVYNRGKDFDTTFNKNRLQVFNITLNEYLPLLDKINAEIDHFVADLKRLKENPLLTEQDFLPPVLVTLSNAVLAIEDKLSKYKAVENEYKEVKKNLFDAMNKYDIKGWEMPNGTKISRVDGTEKSTITERIFDLETFKAENPALYDMYLIERTKTTPARAGYIKITQRG